MLLFSVNAAHSQEALFIHLANGSPPATNSALDSVQRITFFGNNLSVTPFEGDAVIHTLDNITKITFGNVISANMTNPSVKDLDVVIYVTTTGKIVVESPVAIQSLSLFNIDGKILRTTTVETQHTQSFQTSIDVSALPIGIYLIRVETRQQGTIVKKIIKK